MQAKFGQGHSTNCLSWRGSTFNKIAVGDWPCSVPVGDSNKKGSQQLPLQGQFFETADIGEKNLHRIPDRAMVCRGGGCLDCIFFWHLFLLFVFLIKIYMFSLKCSVLGIVKLLQSC